MARADRNRVKLGRKSPAGSEFPGAVEHFADGPVDQPDLTKWKTEFAHLVLE